MDPQKLVGSLIISLAGRMNDFTDAEPDDGLKDDYSADLSF